MYLKKNENEMIIGESIRECINEFFQCQNEWLHLSIAIAYRFFLLQVNYKF